MSGAGGVCGRVQCEQCVWACVGVSSVSGAGGRVLIWTTDFGYVLTYGFQCTI